jgi:hypothetical protein
MGKDLIRNLSGNGTATAGTDAASGVATGSDKSGRQKFPMGCVWLLIAVMLMCFCCFCLNAFGQTTVYMAITGETQVTVCDKESVPVDGTNQYRVYTDKGVYIVADMKLPFVAWRTNSADVYNQLKPGKVYNITTRGFRWSAISAFENIETATPVPNAIPVVC